MLFNSVTYILFLCITVTLWWILPRPARIAMVFIASLTFYAFWSVHYLALLLGTITLDYIAGLGMAYHTRPAARRAWLLMSLITNLGILFFFKYLNFVCANVNSIAGLLGVSFQIPHFEIILPLGISFYVFHSLSYTMDVYRRVFPAKRNYVLFVSYVIFFPQLVPGPILRPVEVIPQIVNRRKFNASYIAIGIRRILYGLFLKVCLADNLHKLVEDGFLVSLSHLSALDVLTLAFLFGFQIYFDFAGYSHVAIGSAWLMGISFPENFDFPYMTVSIRDFWRRWHISLSSWIRDYLYLPLAGAKFHDTSRGGLGEAARGADTERRNFALFASWAIMGLWHGASWTFLIWGLWHAWFVFLYRVAKPLRERLPKSVCLYGGWAVTLLIAMIGWIPFRAASVSQTFEMWRKLLNPRNYLWLGLVENTYLCAAILTAGVIVAYGCHQWLAPRLERYPIANFVLNALLIAVLFSATFVYLRPIRQFIYFQF